MKRRAFLRLTGSSAVALASAPLLAALSTPLQPHGFHTDAFVVASGNFRVGDVITFADHGRRYVITGCVGPTITVRLH